MGLIVASDVYTQMHNIVVKKHPAMVPPHTPVCLLTKNLFELERNYETKSYVAASSLFHGNRGLGQSDQNENYTFSANHVLCKATEKLSVHTDFFLRVEKYEEI